MLTKKQEEFLNIITSYYQKKKEFPTIGTLKKISQYKSYNTIKKYLLQLEKKNYLIYDKTNKKIYVPGKFLESHGYYKIPFINEAGYFHIQNDNLNNKKDYKAYKVKNNDLDSFYIKSKDILIIEKTTNYLNNKIVLANLENKYYLLKYIEKDGFIHLYSDNHDFILTNIENIIGKVILLIRDTMD